MNSRIVLLNLISTFLLLALAVATSAQTRTVGVIVGNKFRYSFAASWGSNDPSATPPSYLVDFNDTQWFEITISAISGTNITGQTTAHYKNGTENTGGVWLDVNTGPSKNVVSFFISANLVPGDSVYTSSPYNTWKINETVPRAYLSGVRETNHFNMASSSGTYSSSNNVYWDNSTGVLVEVLVETTNQTSAYTTTWSEDIQIISSNVSGWTVPEFPTWTPALLILIALTSATIVIARQRQRAR